jgi:hypothetical protein
MQVLHFGRFNWFRPHYVAMGHFFGIRYTNIAYVRGLFKKVNHVFYTFSHMQGFFWKLLHKVFIEIITINALKRQIKYIKVDIWHDILNI